MAPMAEQEHAAEAIVHLQRAAIELIAAARATLDLVEDVVNDPAALTDFLARMSQAPSQAPGRPNPPASGDPARVEHIPVR
jgi:hypothetical protein